MRRFMWAGLWMAGAVLGARTGHAQSCTNDVCVLATDGATGATVQVSNARTEPVEVTLWFPVLDNVRPSERVPYRMVLAPGERRTALRLTPTRPGRWRYTYRFDWQRDPAVACAERTPCLVRQRDAEALRLSVRNPLELPATAFLVYDTHTDTLVVPDGGAVEFAQLLPEAALPRLRMAWRVGDVRAAPDTSYRYALPYPAGERHALAASRDSAGALINFYTWPMPSGTPIRAAREGIVTSVHLTNLQAETYTVQLDHADGTRGIYSGLVEGSVTVALGSFVPRHAPLGLSAERLFTFGVVGADQTLRFVPLQFLSGGRGVWLRPQDEAVSDR